MPRDPRGVAGAPSVRLEVRLLGVVEVVLDGRRLSAFNALRLQRFLALIALNRGPQHRSRLAFLLWPDSNERQARTNLRKLLHEFRQSLPDVEEFVEIDNETLCWISAGPSEVDVLRFRDAVAAGHLELAARLYVGDLLPACYDDWVLTERARIRVEAHRILAGLAREASKQGDSERTIRHAQRVLDLEPTDEAAARILMEAHLALGDTAAALRSYHRYAEVLARDLEVEPGDAIVAVYDQLRGGGTPVRGDAPTPVHTSVAESPFVGRDREWHELAEAWKSARERGAHVALVTGEPGIGKSRLASELGRHARAEGHAVASARAYEAAGRPPWGPIVDLLRSDALQSHIQSLDPVWRAELTRLLPELAEASRSPAPRSGPADARSADDVARRHRLFDAVVRALVPNRPTLLIVDDLQWCDAETIETVGFLVRARSRAPVLVVCTVRWEELPDGHPLPGLADALGRERAVTVVALDRLDQAATTALAARVRAQDPLDPDLAARLWSETEGNPLFVIEALRAGIEAGDDRSVLTPTMRAVLRARLTQVSDGGRRLIEVAAVLGRPFSIALLASATRLAEPELVEHLDELWRRRIVRDQGVTYDFSHDKLRAVALETLGPARRRGLHADVARALARQMGDDPDAAAPQLAAHYDRAGMVEPALDAYRRAGARAVAVFAVEEAVGLFRRALALLVELPASSARDALELDIRIALGSPLVALEGYGSSEAHRLYERAVSLCRTLHRPVDPPILRGLGLARLQGCRFDDCIELARTLVEHESRDPVAATEGHYLLGVSHFWMGQMATARHHLAAGVEAYDTRRRNEHLALYAQDPRAVCVVRLALVELWSGDPGRAAENARLALDAAGELDHPMTSAYVLTYAAIEAAEAGDFSRLTDLLAAAEVLWQRLSDRYLIHVLEALRGWLQVLDGSAEGLDRILQSVTASRAHGETLHLTYTLLLLARARGVSGQLPEGLAATEEGLSWSRSCNQRYLESELWRVKGELAYRSGDAASAAASLRHAVEVAAVLGARWFELRALCSLAGRFPEPALRERLGDLVGSIQSADHLPAYRAAVTFLNESG